MKKYSHYRRYCTLLFTHYKKFNVAQNVALYVVLYVAQNVANEILYSLIALLQPYISKAAKREMIVPAQPLKGLWGAGTHSCIQ